MPIRSWVAFVGKPRELVAGILQSRLRFVEPGQEVELALRMFPGQIITGKVDRIVAFNPAAQLRFWGASRPQPLRIAHDRP